MGGRDDRIWIGSATASELFGAGGFAGNRNAAVRGVTTDPSGSFNTGANTCPTVTLSGSSTADSYVYLTSTGGNTESGTNSSASLIIAAGYCQTLESTLPFVVINEVSTVASVTALQQFMGVTMGTNGAWNIGTLLSNYTGMKNTLRRCRC